MMVWQEVRCPNCNKKVADGLINGMLKITCRGCGVIAVVDRRLDKLQEAMLRSIYN